jgi:hypothetical protein
MTSNSVSGRYRKNAVHFAGNASSLADQKASAEVEESPYIKWARGLYEILASGVVTK